MTMVTTSAMLLNVSLAFEHLPLVLATCALLLILKAILAGAATRILGYPTRTAVMFRMAWTSWMVLVPAPRLTAMTMP